MNIVKKIAVIRNSQLDRLEYGSYLKYLSSMSAKGFHILEIGRLQNTFEKDDTKRYMYSVCEEGRDGFFSLSDDWEKASVYGGAVIYRRLIPRDTVSVKTQFVDILEEEEWLHDRAEEGYVLCAKSGDEYFFEERAEVPEGEFVIEKVGHRDDIGEILEAVCVNGTEYICCSSDGTYYFLTPDVQGESRKQHLRQAIKKTSAISLMTMTCVIIAAIVSAALIALEVTSPPTRPIIFWVFAAELSISALILTVMHIRSGVLKSKYDRVMKIQFVGGEQLFVTVHDDGYDEEALVDRAELAKAELAEEKAISEPSGVVTDVEAYDGDSPEPAEKTLKRSLSKKLRIGGAIAALVLGILYCYLWMSRIIPGTALGSAGFIIAILGIVLLPFWIYSIIGR